MSDCNDTAKHLGRRIADALGPGPNLAYRDAYQACVARSILEKDVRPRGGLRKVAPMGLAAGILLAGIIGAAWLLTPPSPMEYTIGRPAASHELDGWVDNTAHSPLPITFENGSRFEIAQHSAARVVKADKENVRIELSHGRLDAKVEGNGRTKWSVAAGPYAVRVLGTRFSVDWSVDESRFSTAVSKGCVLVTGDGLGAHGVTLWAGQRLLSRDGVVQIARRETGAFAEEETVPSEEAVASVHVEPPLKAVVDTVTEQRPFVKPMGKQSKRRSPGPDRPVAEPEVPEPPSETPDWQLALDDGDWETALVRLGDEKRARALAAADDNTLWMMVKWARQARRNGLARELLVAYRKRFPGSERAATAAFLIGKSSLDLASDFEAAYKWISVYLEEAPSGVLREEAMGRLIVAAEALEKQALRHSAAKRYLDEYPNGDYAERARMLLAE